jgi:hypothetical protein
VLALAKRGEQRAILTALALIYVSFPDPQTFKSFKSSSRNESITRIFVDDARALAYWINQNAHTFSYSTYPRSE